jgi:dipeptidyl aminopeptidase/acylaminoacyl peptidase
LSSSLGELNSCQALSFTNDWICALLQSYTRKPTLILGKLEKKDSGLEVKWTFCETETDTSLSDLVQVELVKFKPNLPNPSFPNLDFEAIFLKPKNSNNMLISFPHGGPHSAFGSEFSTHVAVFYSLGYSILLINFRGSSNFGQDCINSLPGHIGTYDVSDCQVNSDFVTFSTFFFSK